jgi:hypothetical protein
MDELENFTRVTFRMLAYPGSCPPDWKSNRHICILSTDPATDTKCTRAAAFPIALRRKRWAQAHSSEISIGNEARIDQAHCGQIIRAATST